MKRKWYTRSCSMRFLLGLVLVAALVSGLWAHIDHKHRTIDRLEKIASGAGVLGVRGPEWRRKLPYYLQIAFEDVTAVDLSRAQNEETGELFHLPELTDDDFRFVAQFRHLQELLLENRKLTKSNLRILLCMPALTRIDLSGCNVGDEEVALLTRLRKLEFLSLNSTAITNSSVTQLAVLPNLSHLSLSGTVVDDDAIHDLSLMTNVKVLEVWDTQLTSHGIAELRAQLPNTDIFADF